PATGLREARAARDAAKKQLATGQDPALAKKLAKLSKAAAAANSFDAIASELWTRSAGSERRIAPSSNSNGSWRWRGLPSACARFPKLPPWKFWRYFAPLKRAAGSKPPRSC